MRYDLLGQPFHANQRDFGLRDMPITVLRLQRATLVSLIKLRIYSVECLRVASNQADHNCFDTSRVTDWQHAMEAFNEFLESDICLTNAVNMANRKWVEDLSGGRHKLLLQMRSVDDLLYDYETSANGSNEAGADESREER